ncbi:hypothetical protein Mapa_015849 [Marchantia paleacea]|nr:hypothetical protein Mapa_015849 [Marchantia paleacea]
MSSSHVHPNLPRCASSKYCTMKSYTTRLSICSGDNTLEHPEANPLSPGLECYQKPDSLII